MNRSLYALARQGFGFPAPNVFKNLASVSTKPQTFPKVRVRILKAHYQLRRLVTPGEIIALDEPTARGAIALGRAVEA